MLWSGNRSLTVAARLDSRLPEPSRDHEGAVAAWKLYTAQGGSNGILA